MKSIGIVGGAGPLAGVFLFERIISLSGKIYGCHRDADFPKIFLINFPFSEMLHSTRDDAKIRRELRECLNQLRKNGASVLAIACNTLHAFLEGSDEDLVHLPNTLAEYISCEAPLVLCTSTSVHFGLHKPCLYPGSDAQEEVDNIIDQILRGDDKALILKRLERVIRAQTAKTIILGCTELSLFSAHLSLPNKVIIDPLELVAIKIVEKCFLKGNNYVKP